MTDRKRPSLGAPVTAGRPEVDLFDRVYVTRPITRSAHKELEGVLQNLAATADADGALKAITAGLDLLLAPTGTQRKPASEVVQENWDADRLEVGDLIVFFQDIQELTTRPT